MALDPNRLVLGWPNYIDDAELSGGDYVPTLPLAHAQDGRRAVISKTQGLDTTATQFVITLPRRRPMAVFALAAHNLSATATIRVRAYRDEARTDELWDSGYRDVWPVMYGLDDVIWGNDNFWNRRLDEGARETYPPLVIVWFDEPQVGAAVHVELSDPSNLDGAVTFGRPFLANAWQPNDNMSLGVQFGYDSGTELTEARDRARTLYADRVDPKRTVAFDLDWLLEDEAFLRMYRLQRTEDIVGEVLFAYSVTNTPTNLARSFIGRLESLDPLTQPHQRFHSNSMKLMEIL
ncbi:hypothetical protein QWY79_03665 [Halomonas sabkhae]|uniref:hypothetical protein n=1 Tax=Halomonas sabkhae TaxID=626223 RepID=UPI0025B4DE54|nr:hypothetical protein [Halomonas sabkhae]MDN3524360.1 hypothetical protein [Halomonas sabkhae]